ncbi:hypothetical protein LOAG_10255 [Loa loa]|uniref:Uncharacterized protein n=1 Tax=Loa loa TaxID=7209 RepID=A0A1S0TQ58_LOALO|nr:hypothetical protein LOAG_10255 [Loa loa]EFO18240.1 hypothetical protein LOAG_10255 [Loa loa]
MALLICLLQQLWSTIYYICRETSHTYYFLKDKFIQTVENDNGGKYFDVQPRDTESNKKKSLKTISTENDPSNRMQRTVKDASVKGAISEVAVVTTSGSISMQDVTAMDSDRKQLDYPIGIITRPRRREDLSIHKLEARSDISLPTLKEICAEEKPHPHPIPPTASGILEVRSLTEQMYRNPMNCL